MSGGLKMYSSCLCVVLLHALACCWGALPDTKYNLFFNLPLPPGPHTVTAGQMLVLDCEAGGSPTPTIQWMHNSRRILQGSERRTKNLLWDEDEESHDHEGIETLRLGSTRSRLFIDCVTPSDQGKYTCVASANGKSIMSSATLHTNLPGYGSGETPLACVLQKRGFLRANPARVYMWTSQRLEFEGADVQLFCRGDGKPSPKITWYDQEGNRIYNGERYRLLENGDLFIPSVNFVDNMGVYTCLAENPYGKDVVETFLYPTTP